MKKSFIRIILMLMMVIPTIGTLNAEHRVALGSGKTEKFTVGSFSKLSVTHPIKVTYNPSTSGKYEVTVVSTRPNKGELVIDCSQNTLKLKLDVETHNGIKVPDYDINVTVSGPFLTEISAYVGAKVTVTEPMTVKKISFDTNSGAAIEMNGLSVKEKLDIEATSGSYIIFNGNVTAASYEADITSGANVKILGTLSSTDVEIAATSGSSHTIASLKASEVEVDATSASSVTIKEMTADTIDIDTTSAAKVKVSGTARTGEASATSTAKVDVRDLKCSEGFSVTSTSSMGKVLK